MVNSGKKFYSDSIGPHFTLIKYVGFVTKHNICVQNSSLETKSTSEKFTDRRKAIPRRRREHLAGFPKISNQGSTEAEVTFGNNSTNLIPTNFDVGNNSTSRISTSKHVSGNKLIKIEPRIGKPDGNITYEPVYANTLGTTGTNFSISSVGNNSFGNFRNRYK